MRRNFQPFCRLFHVSCYNSANIHRAFRKVLNSNSSRKRKLKFEEHPVLPVGTDFKRVEEKSKGTPGYRRVNVLNKLFMRYVTDLIANGQYCDEYNSLGIEITKIQIAPDYKQLNIFWVNKNPGNEDDIISFLSENAYTLRHELSRLNVIGIVPPIGFVKDKHYAQIVELDKRMEQADYGDDYEPLSVSRLKHQLELYCPIKENFKVQLKKLEADVEEEPLDITLPEMPQNVLGLDHAAIIKRMTQHKNIHANYTASESNSRLLESWQNSDDTCRNAFKSFLLKRQIASQKMKKEEKNYIPDREYMKEEMKRSFEEHYGNIDMNIDKFEDYIEDSDEK